MMSSYKEKIDDLPEFGEGETEEDYEIKEDFVKPTAPEPTLRDVLMKVVILSNDVNEFLEAIKALGAEMLKSRTELDDQMGKLNSAFVEVIGTVAELRNEVRVPKSRYIVDQIVDQKQRPPEPTAGNYDSLPWRDNQYGQWIFAKNQEGQITPGAEKLTADLIAAGGKLKNVGGRDYRLQDKFINRSKKK